MERVRTRYQCRGGCYNGKVCTLERLTPGAAVIDSRLDSCCSVLYYSNPSLPKAKAAFKKYISVYAILLHEIAHGFPFKLELNPNSLPWPT